MIFIAFSFFENELLFAHNLSNDNYDGYSPNVCLVRSLFRPSAVGNRRSNPRTRTHAATVSQLSNVPADLRKPLFRIVPVDTPMRSGCLRPG
jgi:hypothetical protein